MIQSLSYPSTNVVVSSFWLTPNSREHKARGRRQWGGFAAAEGRNLSRKILRLTRHRFNLDLPGHRKLCSWWCRYSHELERRR